MFFVLHFDSFFLNCNLLWIVISSGVGNTHNTYFSTFGFLCLHLDLLIYRRAVSQLCSIKILGEISLYLTRSDRFERMKPSDCLK